MTFTKERAAVETLESKGYTWHGGKFWKPPIGKAPAYITDELPVVKHDAAVESLATDLMKRIDKITGERHSIATLSALRASIVEACRAAMLQGSELPAYEIKSFGMFDARSLDQDGRDLVTTIQMFHFERGTVPEDVFSRGVVAKHALQAIINALQQKCDGMDDTPIPQVWSSPQQEVKS